MCVLTLHGVVEIWLCAFKLVVEGELRDQQNLIVIVNQVSAPGFTCLIRPKFELQEFLSQVFHI